MRLHGHPRVPPCYFAGFPLRCPVPQKRPSRAAPPLRQLAPVIKPLLAPVVEPVLARLDRHEQLLTELKAALEVQFKRTAAIQAQLDQLVAGLPKRRA